MLLNFHDMYLYYEVNIFHKVTTKNNLNSILYIIKCIQWIVIVINELFWVWSIYNYFFFNIFSKMIFYCIFDKSFNIKRLCDNIYHLYEDEFKISLSYPVFVLDAISTSVYLNLDLVHVSFLSSAAMPATVNAYIHSWQVVLLLTMHPSPALRKLLNVD